MSRFQELSPEEFATAVAATPRPYVLDVRERDAFEAGHVPGAACIHVHELTPRRAELPAAKITRILIVGDTEKRAAAAANWLALVGYVDVAVLAGGFAAWTGPLETGPPVPPKPWGPQLRII